MQRSRASVFTSLVAIALAVSLFACAGTPLSTFNDKVAAGERTVLLVQTSATKALRAGAITADQDALIQKQVEIVHTSLKMAKSLQASKPEAAAAQLTSALEQLESLKKQTGAN